MFVELHLYAPLEGRSEDTRLALHEIARQLKSEHGLRQVSVLEEQDGHPLPDVDLGVAGRLDQGARCP